MHIYIHRYFYSNTSIYLRYSFSHLQIFSIIFVERITFINIKFTFYFYRYFSSHFIHTSVKSIPIHIYEISVTYIIRNSQIPIERFLIHIYEFKNLHLTLYSLTIIFTFYIQGIQIYSELFISIDIHIHIYMLRYSHSHLYSYLVVFTFTSMFIFRYMHFCSNIDNHIYNHKYSNSYSYS